MLSIPPGVPGASVRLASARPLPSPSVTDLPSDWTSVPSRLGVRLTVLDDGQLSGDLLVNPALCDRGVVPAYALVFLADVVAGVSIDTDPDAWAFTSDVSVRAPLQPAPGVVTCTPVELRGGRRSSTCEAELTVDGHSWGHCFIAFSRVPRRDTDPVKVAFDPADSASRLSAPPLTEGLRATAGFRSLDPAGGIVSVDLRPDLLNPAGAMQGAMVAGLAEAAAEDLADHLRLLGADRHVVTDVEVRYLAQNRVSPIVSRARIVGPPSAGTIRVDLVDDGGRGRLTTSVLLRVQPALV